MTRTTVLGIAALVIVAPPASGGNADGAALLADGYDANLQRFQCLDCRFEILDGTAPTLAEASRGEIKSVRSRTTGRWLISGRRVRFELLCDEQYLKAAFASAGPTGNSSRALTIPCPHRKYLSDGDFNLNLSPLISGGNIRRPGTGGDRGLTHTPFDLAIVGQGPESLPRQLRNQGSIPLKVEILDSDGDGVLVRACSSKPELPCGYYRTDPEKGFLPVECWLTPKNSDKRAHHFRITDAQLQPNGGWFPMRVVAVIRPDDKPPFWVQRMVVTAIRTPDRLDDSEFAITVDTRIQLSDPNEIGAVIGWPPQPIRVTDLPRIYESCHAAAPIHQARTREAREMGFLPDEPAPPRSYRRWWVIGGVAAALLLIAGGWHWRARRSRAA